MNINDINSAIIGGTFNNDELNSIAQAVVYARAQLGKQVKRSISVGSSVEFKDNRNKVINGNVTKVCVKYVQVSTQFGLFRVPSNMLSIV
jgi:hypothetical protein